MKAMSDAWYCPMHTLTGDTYFTGKYEPLF